MRFFCKQKICYIVAPLLLIIVVLATRIKLTDKEDFEGIFVLKGTAGQWLEITDDLFPEETDRLLWHVPYRFVKTAATSNDLCKGNSCSYFEWNQRSGRGFIKNCFSNGRKLLICLGRFVHDPGDTPMHGLFLGGNLPTTDPDSHIFDKDESGMAYFDGQRYFHIWCNVNETIYDARQAMLPIYPSTWQFMGSSILEASSDDITLSSSHRVTLGAVPLQIDKFFFYHSGDTFFILKTTVRNIGRQPASFIYSYGDEPWLGNYGSSSGNIGWLKEGTIQREMFVDTRTHTFFGMFDHGNELAGEKPADFTGKANFIEWSPAGRPDMAYFSNSMGPPATTGAPLVSQNCRFIGLRWGPRAIAPGESFTFNLAIGMAHNDPKTGLPVKPETGLNNET